MLGNFIDEEVDENPEDSEHQVSYDTEDLFKKMEIENQELEKKYRELYENYLRTLADFDNFKKRTKKESINSYKSGQADVLKDILDFSDDLQRGREFLATCKNEGEFLTGIELIENKLKNFLVSHNTLCFGEPGDGFDPKLHEAIASESVEDPELEGKILQVVRKGYVKEDEVLRPAQVIVAHFTENLPGSNQKNVENCN
ncbi:nucleotide exchange factor GrpE [candidate division WOR-3 bacterium]|nr:nucleotide exchange factor GrpE [candidate division WOR-3 bacterium]